MSLKVGDRVKVINSGHIYADYFSWLEGKDIDEDTIKKWVKGASPKNGSEYTIKKIAQHDSYNEELFLIENDDSAFIMGTCDKSLRLIEELPESVEDKKDNFKIKALKDAGTYGQLKKGEGYEFINGRTTWSNGSVSSYYSSFDDLKDTCTWGNHCHIELTKEETEVESSKKEDNFKVKCNKSYCSNFWTEGKIYEFIDGYTTWDNGDSSYYYLNYENFVYCNGVSSRLDFEEYVEADLQKTKKGSEKAVIGSKKVFNWDEFKGSSIKKVHCNTEGEAKVFCKLMHKQGLKWRSGESYLLKTNYSPYMIYGIDYYGDGGYNNSEDRAVEDSDTFLFSNHFTEAGELKNTVPKAKATSRSVKSKTTQATPVKENPLLQAIKESQKETKNQTNKKERTEENNMKNNLSAIFGETVGKITDGMVAITFNGEVAIKRNEDEYVRFNAATNTIENQMDFVMKEAGEFLFLLPVNEVQAGDVIKKNNTYYQVIGEGKTGGLTVVGIKTGTKKNLIKETNIMGFNFFFKVVNLFGAMSGSGDSGINPMLLTMLMSDDDEDESMLLPMLMCGGMGALGGSGTANQGIMGQGMNPMMMALMLGDKGKKGSGESGIDMKTMMMMNMMGQQGGTMNPIMMAMMIGNGKMDMKSIMMMNMFSQNSSQGAVIPAQPVQQVQQVQASKPKAKATKKAVVVETIAEDEEELETI